MALPKLNGISRILAPPPAPSPCALQSDGAGRLGRSGWRLWPSGVLAMAILTGCAQHSAEVLGSLSPAATQPVQFTSQHKLAAPSWNTVFQKWWQAATKPQSVTSFNSNQTSRPVVFINVAVIAAHHPAWKLADALEHGGTSRVALAALPLPATVAGLPSQAAPVPFGPLNVGVPGGVPGFYEAAKTVTVRDLDQLQTAAYQKQAGALQNFMADAATYQAQNRAAQAEALKSALAEDIEVAQRLNLAALTPTLPSDPIQLEMTNLRLALLKNLYATPQEREQARQRLSALEAQWEAKLRNQETQRLDELARLRQERPQRLRQAGETRINDTLNAAAQQDTTAREAILRAHDTLLAQDFTPDTTRLGLVLPAATLPAQRLADLVAPPMPRKTAAGPKVSETFQVKITSGNIYEHATTKTRPRVPRSGVQANHGELPQAATIHALRAQAWQDAERWAAMAARRAGWTQYEVRAGKKSQTNVADRTAEALRILNLS